jgi:hypothetical protein
VPVTLAPGVFLNSGGASLIAGEADRWKAATAPPAAPGQSWTLTVTIASEVDPASPRPLLSLSRMVYRIQP